MVVKRAYDASRRRAATRATRLTVVEAAQRLFISQGYPATTIGRISGESGVPEATIYRLFGSKRGILKVVVDVAFGGDDQAIEFQHRPEVLEAFAKSDPGAMLDAFAQIARALLHRSGELQHVLATSATVDEEVAAMLETIRSQRHRGQARIVRELARRKALRPGLTQKEAADVVYAVMSPEVHRILTTERGWSEDGYQAWLAHTLRTQLLRGCGPSAGARRTTRR
jgi:AcrR family transcriptional regulator